ncbi:PLB2 [Candida pseudojiufengensis]|uniref:PLB2 n=1 Tax=Candida pseudojiufengensis TaxID=497109 RepID=UPI002224938C|nr:PLB2 [Candida pseudojiufengensis]KAI5963119.1 PLB2 [Candida pseudojiufengensis]
MLFEFLIIVISIASWATSASSHGYEPEKSTCPINPLVRSATGLSKEETNYIESHYVLAKQSLEAYLSKLDYFNASKFLSEANPTIGLAFSGGGYRAQLCGAGQYAALDSRTNVVNGKGLGGLLQSSNYIVGLSGGSWLVGSVVSSNLISIDELINNNQLWQTTNSILNYFDNSVENLEMWFDIGEQVLDKQEAGFGISITDVWGRALSYPLLTTKPYYGAGYRFNDVLNETNFRNHYSPFPILVALGRVPNTNISPSNSTVFSLTPVELGSESPYLGKFVQSKYLGTKLDSGQPINDESCVQGFDNTGFYYGTSSSVFNEVVLYLDNSTLPDFLKELITEILLDPIEKANVDVAIYDPNPFYSKNNANNTIEESESLYLVDGGEDGQNVPLYPLLKRNVSCIVAFDNSADYLNWPDGTSLVTTYERQFSKAGENTPFPYVPGQSSFRNLNLTSKPTFFGCDAKNLSTLTDNIYGVPIVVYIANRPFTYWSNTSTFKLEYSLTERNAMISNGFAVASRLNGTLDEDFDVCVGCAIIHREEERLGIEQTDQCKKCFKKYCWDGTIYTGNQVYDNFDDNGVTNDWSWYNKDTIPGYNLTSPTKFKHHGSIPKRNKTVNCNCTAPTHWRKIHY